MYEVLEVSLADVPRLYGYMLDEVPLAAFSLKGFDYPWLLRSRSWSAGERVLDVGSAYSPMPLHLQKTYGCEVWAADDFGGASNEPFWTRGNSPQEYIAAHPEVKFVLERLGDPEHSSLPAGYFDVVYSLSTLEHVPPDSIRDVLRHMDLLLKPGGEMLHAIDIYFPSNGGWKRMLAALGFDFLWPLLPARLQDRGRLLSPRGFARLAFRTLGARHRAGRDLSVWNMVLNPDVLTDSYNAGLKRIRRDRIEGYRYRRCGSLMLRLRKLA